MKVLVTGGAGFIGSHIVESLLALGHTVKIFDNFSSGNLENLKSVKADVEIIRGDIRDYAALKTAMQGSDWVSHQAAQLEIFRSTDDPLFDLDVNTLGTLNILKAAKETGVAKVLNASSSCIYGQVDGPTKETHPPRPNWAYGVSKLAAEKYCNIYSDAHELPVVNLRYAIVYGEREWYRRVLPIFVKRAIEGKPLVIFGAGQQIRDFVHVSDIVALHNECFLNPKADGQNFNAGTGRGTTIRELAETLQKLSEHTIEIIHEDTAVGEFSKLVPEKKRNTAELQNMWLDTLYVTQTVGWRSQTSLEAGLSRMMTWARENLHRWNGITYSNLESEGPFPFLARPATTPKLEKSQSITPEAPALL